MRDRVRPDLHPRVGQGAYLRPGEIAMGTVGHPARLVAGAKPRHDEEARLLPAREEARQHLRGGVLVAVVEGEHHRVPRELPRAVVRVEDLAKRDGLEPLRTEEVEMGVQLVRGDRQRFSPVAHRVVHEDGYALAARGAEGRAEEQRCLRTRHPTRTYHFPPADALSGPRSRRRSCRHARRSPARHRRCRTISSP